MISEEHLLMAIFSHIAYDYFPIRACKCEKIKSRIEISLDNAKEHHKDLAVLQTYQYLCHGFGSAFKSEERKNIVIAFTGTDFALPCADNFFRIIEELADDVAIFFFDSPFSISLKKAVKFVNQIKAQYPNYTISITGHSLGGNIAERVAYQTQDPCITYNAFGSAFIYMTKPRDPKTLSLRGTNDGLLFRKLDELSDNTILFKDFPHKVSAWTGFEGYYYDKQPENKMNFITNGLITFVFVMMIFPFLILFALTFCIIYGICIRPQRKRRNNLKYITKNEIEKACAN